MTVLKASALPRDRAPSSTDRGQTAWRAIAFLTVILFAGAVMRTIFGPLQEAAKLDLKLSDFDIGLVQGLGAGAPVAIVAVPLAWVIDHGNRVRLVIVMMAICVIGTLWTAFAGGLTTLFLARVLSALGAGCTTSAIISLVADIAAPDRRGRSIVVLAMGAYVGSAAAFVLAGLMLKGLADHPIASLAGMAPWRATHLLLGLIGTLLLFPLFFLREPIRREVEVASAKIGPTLRAIWAKRRFLMPLFVGQIGVTMADTAAGIWATPVLIRQYHLQPSAFAGWVGGLILVAGFFGSVLAGFAADFGHKTGRRGGLLFAAVIATAIGVPAALFPIMPGIGGFQLCFFFLLFTGTVCAVVASTAVTVLIPNEERGATMSVFGIINALIGMSLAPTVVTLGSQALGGEGHLALSLAITGVVTGLLSFGGYFFAMRNSPLNATDWR